MPVVGPSEQALRRAAGQRVFDRGEDYLRYVHGLLVSPPGRATATIRARRVYQVSLVWAGDSVRGDCTCPYAADGSFCKHMVAVGLAVAADGADLVSAEPPDATGEYLAALGADELRGLLAELMAEVPELGERLGRRAAVAGGDPAQGAELLKRAAQQALAARGFIDYRRSFDVAAHANQVLDDLQREIVAGRADLVRPALLYATTRLQRLVESADDSSGVLGDAAQRALDLYAWSCREGSPDRTSLARWLVRFRVDSPGWPVASLGHFLAAFDERALALYRELVASADGATPSPEDRSEVDRMLLELADHDGDVDRAVVLLSQGDHPRFGAIVQRLRDAQRTEEMLTWTDRAVREGRIGRYGDNDFWLGVDEVVAAYLSAGRTEAALGVLRAQVLSQPGPSSLAALLEVAAPLDRAIAERAWAMAALREQAATPQRTGAALVEIALAEGDLDGAWALATELGVGHAWRALADASLEQRPAEAARLFMADIDRDLVHANSAIYESVAQRLLQVREILEGAGDAAAFDEYLRDLRARHHRRPSLMAALDRAGLRVRR